MTLDSNGWGTLAAFSRSSHALVAWISLAVPRVDAQLALRRPPDFDDSHVVSWGHLTCEEAEQLVALEPASDLCAETLALARSLFAATDAPIVTLYYQDSRRGY